LKPKTPQKCAGMRIDPPMSVPMPSGLARAATSAASPPLLPPGVREASHGLRAAPQMRLADSGSMRHCGTLLRTNGIAPWSRSSLTRRLSCSAGAPHRTCNPQVESQPAMSSWSLTDTGRPCSAPSGLPAARAESASSAAASASAKHSCAFVSSLSPTCRAREQKARVICTEVSLPAVISSSSAVALRLQMWRILSAAGEWSVGAGHGATSRLRLYASRAASRLARALAARAERSAAAGLGERRERR